MMQKYFRYFLVVLFAIPLFQGCKKDSVIPPDPYYREYFTAEAGQYIIYQCDSIVFDDFNGTIDTFRFKIKEYYESEFIDNAGRKAMRIERFKQAENASNWVLSDVWQVVKTDLQVEKVEEDVRMIKLIFPVVDEKEWNINALNNVGARTVAYKDVHLPYETETLSFDSTVTVENTDPQNLINEYRDTEIFAKGLGMIYKRFVNVEYVTPPAVGVESGFVFTMEAIEFGKE
jgi:hypothetical protein